MWIRNNTLLIFQVHPGRLARGGDHYEGFLQPYAARDSGLCRPLLGSAFCPKGSATVAWNCLHGNLYTVRMQTHKIHYIFYWEYWAAGIFLLQNMLHWRREEWGFFFFLQCQSLNVQEVLTPSSAVFWFLFFLYTRPFIPPVVHFMHCFVGLIWFMSLFPQLYE